ncbi:MAG: heme o synthase [Vicinamibacterales bacterium]
MKVAPDTAVSGVVSGVVPDTVPDAAAGRPGRPADFITLMKPRLNLLALFTTLAGLYLAAPDGVPLALLAHTLAGTALVAGGAAALNQVWERRTDALMHRTGSRPLPQGRLGVGESTGFGLLLSVLGLGELALGVNLATAAVALVTLVSYVAVYTPLKTRTWHSTLVGAFPGALPPVIGWAAATGGVGWGAVTLFAIIFFWQMPHFLALAWLFREDYARAGMLVLPVIEPDGRSTGRHALLYAGTLVGVSATPVAVGLAGSAYLLLAGVLGIALLALCYDFRRSLTQHAARRVFLASITYLPLLLGGLLLDRLWLR